MWSMFFQVSAFLCSEPEQSRCDRPRGPGFTKATVSASSAASGRALLHVGVHGKNVHMHVHPCTHRHMHTHIDTHAHTYMHTCS